MKGAAATGHNGTLGLIRNTQRVSGKQVAFRYLLVGLFSSAAWVGSSCAKNAAVLPSLPTRDTIMAPPELANTGWLEDLRAAQLKTVGRFNVYHDSPIGSPRAASPSSTASSTTPARPTRRCTTTTATASAVADVDGDGLPDLYFVNQLGGNQLWRNLGGGRFEDVTAAAGVARAGKVGVSASFADIDNDGDADLYVTTVRGGNLLFENDGKGRFTRHLRGGGPRLRRATPRARCSSTTTATACSTCSSSTSASTRPTKSRGDGYQYYVGIDRTPSPAT